MSVTPLSSSLVKERYPVKVLSIISSKTTIICATVRFRFRRRLIQDARAHALGAYKSTAFADITAFTDIAAHIALESTNHLKVSSDSRFFLKQQYCEGWGISLEDLSATRESAACSAYARYILDVSSQGDVLDLYLAVASCLLGYGEVGLWLKRGVELGRFKIEGNPYGSWIETYSGEDYLKAIFTGIGASCA